MLRANRPRPAFHAMRTAVRESPRNWRMWQNLQYVSLDVDELQTAMLAVRRLVELDEEGSSSRHDLQRSVDTVVDVRVLGYVSVVCLYFSLFILTLVKSILASKALTQFESAAAATVANDVDVEQRRTLANVLLGNVLELLRFTSAKLSASDELWTIIALTHERLARQSATTTTSRLAHCTRAIDARLKALRAADPSRLNGPLSPLSSRMSPTPLWPSPNRTCCMLQSLTLLLSHHHLLLQQQQTHQKQQTHQHLLIHHQLMVLHCQHSMQRRTQCAANVVVATETDVVGKACFGGAFRNA